MRMGLKHDLLVLIDGGFTNKEKTCTEPKFIPVITLFLFFLTLYYFFSLVCFKSSQEKKNCKVF